MTDALERIEREAKERRQRHDPQYRNTTDPYRQAEAAVDELIAMVREACEERDSLLHLVGKSQDERLGILHVENQRIAEQRDEARADVLKLRDGLDDMAAMPWRGCQLDKDTEHYEQYR